MRLFLILLLLPCALFAQDEPIDFDFELAKRDRKIVELEKRINHLWDDLHEKLDPHGEKEDDGHDHDGEVRVRLLDLSLNIMTAAGTSTSTNDELSNLQLGNHDPRRRGFTLQQAELAFAGAIEPFFAGEAYIVATDMAVELEEAFVRSLFLRPYFEMKAGYFFTEFGRINRQHPHQWRWADQPIAVGRILSAEGMRGVGGRVAVGFDGTWASRWLLSVQNADDASMTSFLGEGHSHGHDEEEHGDETVGGWPHTERHTETLGDLLYMLRWENHIDIGQHIGLELGASAAYGPNASGDSGRTWLVGADLMLQWEHDDCWMRVEGEFLYRYYQANRAEHEDGEVLNATVLGDWGAYVELTGSPVRNFMFGVRLEHAAGFRSGEESRSEDPLRDNRWRVSPLVAYTPIDEVKITLQYNFDHADHLGGHSSHSIWIGLRILFGVHKHLH